MVAFDKASILYNLINLEQILNNSKEGEGEDKGEKGRKGVRRYQQRHDTSRCHDFFR